MTEEKDQHAGPALCRMTLGSARLASQRLKTSQKMKSAHGAVDLAKLCMTVHAAVYATDQASSQLNVMTMVSAMTLTNWPFPQFPATPWTSKQIKEYAQQQRAQLPESPM